MAYLHTPWRFIDSGELAGPDAMAIDEALLACFDPSVSRPVFRCYGWNPPSFSCGRFQDVATILDLPACREREIPIVRRVTGGGVLYHSQELTYSLLCSPSALTNAGNVKQTFYYLTSFLIQFYRRLGLSACYASQSPRPDFRLGERTPLCFAGRESCDILIAGKKIGGNAQRRTREAIFQHGSIPLRPRAAEGMEYILDRSRSLPAEITSLAEEGIELDRQTLSELLRTTFQESMGIVLHNDSLTPREEAVAKDLRSAVLAT
jgi:lipoate-protein ligase A